MKSFEKCFRYYHHVSFISKESHIHLYPLKRKTETFVFLIIVTQIYVVPCYVQLYGKIVQQKCKRDSRILPMTRVFRLCSKCIFKVMYY